MGDVILVLFGIALLGYVLLAPAIALFLALRADRRTAEIEKRLLEMSLEARRAPAPGVTARAAHVRRAMRGPEPAGARPVAAWPSEQPKEMGSETGSEQLPLFVEPAARAAEPAAPGEPAPPEVAAAARQPAAAAQRDTLPDAPAASLEERLGLTWLTRVGAAAFLVGVLFFFKYAVDNDWIGPVGRVAAGAVTGAVLLVVAEAIRDRTRRRFVHSLIGIGLAVLFISLWASAAFYQVLPVSLAFVANTLVLFIGAALAMRHRGEPILILVLIAGFLNPIILSTGEDRPLELFGYLLLITSVALVVALRQGFRIVPWLAVAGVGVLFGGWYERFFDASDRSAQPYADVPLEELVGPYLALSSRAVPLAACVLFTGQWLCAAMWLRRAGKGRVATVLGVSALVLAHVGITLLLADSPRALALGAIALALISIFVLRDLGATDMLVVPMAAAFLALLVVTRGTPEGQRTLLVGLLGAWTAAYLIGFLASDRLRSIKPQAAIASAAGAGLFACLAGILLAESRPTLYSLLLAGCSAFVAFVASRSGLRALLVWAVVLSAGAIVTTAAFVLQGEPQAHADAAFLGAVALWALVYLVGVAEGALRRAGPVSGAAILTASLATLGFVIVALVSTSEHVPTLRALLTAAAGVADLGLGVVLLRYGSIPEPDDKGNGKNSGPERASLLPQDQATLLFGQALGLFAAALAFALSGATVTILWAVLAVVAAAMAARTESPLWLGIAGLLFLAAALRTIGVDALDTQRIVDRFFRTGGRDGSIAVPVLFNARAYALAGTGLCWLVAARLLARPARLRPVAALSAVLGYGFLLALAITEVRAAVTSVPEAPPYALDAIEWGAFEAHYRTVLDAQRGSLAMMTTLVLGLAAALLLAAGFIARHAFHRYLGLALFFITVGKLGLWDVWSIERIYQIVLFTGIGALLVGGGFLYARFGRRIVALMRDGAAGGSLLLLVWLAGGVAEAQAQSAPALAVGKYQSMRRIRGVSAAGDYRFEVDFDLYKASRSRELFDDLRIAGPDGAEVAYVLRDVDAAKPSAEIPSTMLDPSVSADGAAYATFAIAKSRGPVTEHCRVVLRVEGRAFLRKVRVETGETPAALGVVAEGAFVYRVPQEIGAVEQLAVRYPLSRASLVRVTLMPDLPEAPVSRVRIEGGTVSCGTPDTEDPVRAMPLAIEETQRDKENKTTVVTLDAGAEGVPLAALLLDVDPSVKEFSRTVDVTATSYRAVWPRVGGGRIYRVEPQEGFVIASSRIPLVTSRKRWLQLTVHDGDSAPLAIRSVAGEVRVREVWFRAVAAGEHLLYIGDAMGERPVYDLSDILSRAERPIPPATVTLGPVERNLKLGSTEPPPHLPLTERYRSAIGIVLAVGLLALSLWTVRLLRKGTPGGPDSKKGTS